MTAHKYTFRRIAATTPARIGLTVAALLSAKAAVADPICTAITDMMVPLLSTAEIVLPSPFPGEVKCSSALAQSGGRFTYCAWRFDYRAPLATDAFRQLVGAVPGCLGTELAGKDDQNVNHPDFYELQVFKSGEAEVSVSLKDKGALQETYVFLRVEETR